MTDLDRFALAWTVLLVVLAFVRLLGPAIVAHLLARAFRRLCRFDRDIA